MSKDISKKIGAVEHNIYSIILKRSDISYFVMRKDIRRRDRPLLTILNGIYDELEKE